MTLKLSLTVKDNLQIFGFFQLKSLGRAKNSICTSGVYDFYPSVLCRTLGLRSRATNYTSGKNHARHSLGA
jgi:hypothetical protein